MFCFAFLDDDPAQSDRARALCRRATADEPCFVNPIVLAEFAWTLTRNYKHCAAEVARLIDG